LKGVGATAWQSTPMKPTRAGRSRGGGLIAFVVDLSAKIALLAAAALAIHLAWSLI
jgi:hypothetical protein